MNPAVYQIIHLLALLTLTAGAFYSFAGAPETKKKVMIITGIASVLMLVRGQRLHPASLGDENGRTLRRIRPFAK